MLSIEEIREILPHRHPFLLVDRVLELEPGKRAVGLKNVSINEPYFEGHFPGYAIMPAVLIVEAMAQVAGVILLSMGEHRGKLAVFAGVDKARFRRKVHPGDALITEAELIWARSGKGKVRAVASVDNQIAAEGELMFALADLPPAAQYGRLLTGSGE